MWRHETSRDPEGVSFGRVRVCATGSWAIFAIVGPFHRKWRHQTSGYPEGIPLEGWGARMRNRKLRDIRSYVTRRASPGKYWSAHARSEVLLGCDLICSQTQPKRGLKCFISPTNHITGNWTNQITRNKPTRSLIPKMNNQLQPS
jgi:hypothetical protein